MGRHWKSDGWAKSGGKKKYWGEKSWKKKWAKTCKRDDRDDRKDFDNKFKCDFDFKIKKWGWADKDGFGCGGWTSKFKFKDCGVDLKIKKWACDWKPKQDNDDGFCGNRNDDCDRGQIKFRDCKIDWKGCEVDPPVECKPEIITETVCDFPEEPKNTAPEIVAPTNTQILIDESADQNVVTKVVAEDLDDDTLVYSINDATDPDSADADLFTIDSQTGEVMMLEAPHATGSADGDWRYQIEVEVTDGQATDSIILDLLYVSAA